MRQQGRPRHRALQRPATQLVASLAGVAAITGVYFSWLHVANDTTAALTFLLLVLFVAALSPLWVALATSVTAALALDFFFLPPVGTFNIDDSQDWVAFLAFIVVAFVASHLSSVVRAQEKELGRAEAARQGVEIKSTLLASLAHDLRTPLTAIGTAVSNLSALSLSDDERSAQICIARAGVDRLARLFQNLLEMANIDTGGITPSPEWVHPSALVEGARHQIEPALRGHVIKVVDRSGNQLVRVDPRLLAPALAHVLENAAQYSPKGAAVTVTHEVASAGIGFVVEDEGIGIADKDLPHLFERFYRGGESHQHSSGTGMGLAIVQGLLVAQGGHVRVENRAGGGSRFSIFVPAEIRLAADEQNT